MYILIIYECAAWEYCVVCMWEPWRPEEWRRSSGPALADMRVLGTKLWSSKKAISPASEKWHFCYITRNYIKYKFCFYFLKGLIHYGRDNQNLDILLFQEVLEYMSRIDRVLSFPGGSLLLAGRSGVGRRTVTSLVSHMHGAVLFSPKISRGYEPKQFRNDLKHVSCGQTSFCYWLELLSLTSVT